MTDDAPTAPGYQDALAELDEILRELEGSDVDVDRLADRVERASELIALCRDKISSARVRIRQVTTDLDAGAAAEPS
ncbi:exodeoxyribonuclease VII small subunit [Ilumatobacter sp.]|uniref:exodeoxyribonuclease VII small subunit n=1 Tax=Ilumatobacter sp. TaxID=1967498 RepID=UPI003B5227B3